MNVRQQVFTTKANSDAPLLDVPKSSLSNVHTAEPAADHGSAPGCSGFSKRCPEACPCSWLAIVVHCFSSVVRTIARDPMVGASKSRVAAQQRYCGSGLCRRGNRESQQRNKPRALLCNLFACYNGQLMIAARKLPPLLLANVGAVCACACACCCACWLHSHTVLTIMPRR